MWVNALLILISVSLFISYLIYSLLYLSFYLSIYLFIILLLSIYLFHIKNDGMSSFGRNHNHYLLWLCERVVAVHKFHKAKFIFTLFCLSPPPPLKKKGLERTVPPSFCKPLNNLKTILYKISISLVLLHILGGKN